ncbi:hypothetical protein B0H21DRAFT_711332 [Amylocystis lapponica]|nr:hypothetical protein B0H21DRAFT_711332 [Amylocystis lapponica]
MRGRRFEQCTWRWQSVLVTEDNEEVYEAEAYEMQCGSADTTWCDGAAAVRRARRVCGSVDMTAVSPLAIECGDTACGSPHVLVAERTRSAVSVRRITAARGRDGSQVVDIVSAMSPTTLPRLSKHANQFHMTVAIWNDTHRLSITPEITGAQGAHGLASERSELAAWQPSTAASSGAELVGVVPIRWTAYDLGALRKWKFGNEKVLRFGGLMYSHNELSAPSSYGTAAEIDLVVGDIFRVLLSDSCRPSMIPDMSQNAGEMDSAVRQIESEIMDHGRWLGDARERRENTSGRRTALNVAQGDRAAQGTR